MSACVAVGAGGAEAESEASNDNEQFDPDSCTDGAAVGAHEAADERLAVARE